VTFAFAYDRSSIPVFTVFISSAVTWHSLGISELAVIAVILAVTLLVERLRRR
jgi:hypothetical protein